MNAREFCMKHAATLWRPAEEQELAAEYAVQRALEIYAEICETVPEAPNAHVETSDRRMAVPDAERGPTPRPRHVDGGRVAYSTRCVCGGRTTVSVDVKDAVTTAGPSFPIMYCGRCGTALRISVCPCCPMGGVTVGQVLGIPTYDCPASCSCHLRADGQPGR